MLEEERIREQPCGCRYDVVTGIYTFRCPACADLLATVRDVI